ncbi:unnamed protein product [Toxocara canis]|uniref:DUF3179 domain-containing protein n=1 Tax=Toxocara canis TaxID=6265 RepID=A0A183U9U9_TOXCA|nr:unnamed protein product [Toxocara canis]
MVAGRWESGEQDDTWISTTTGPSSPIFEGSTDPDDITLFDENGKHIASFVPKAEKFDESILRRSNEAAEVWLFVGVAL